MAKQPDHDLLIEIRTELGFVRQEVKDLKDNFAGKIQNLEVTKAETAVTSDHELRIRRLERWGTMAIGALAIVEFVAKFWPFR